MRGRVNIHGALNTDILDAALATSKTVDGVTAIPLLAKTEQHNHDKCIIHVIWDNAANPKSPYVKAFLARSACRINLI